MYIRTRSYLWRLAVTKSLEQYEAEFNKLYQNLSDSLNSRLITGDDYDRVGVIMKTIYPKETRLANIEEGHLDEDCDPDEIGGIPSFEMLFDAVEDKAMLINDFRKVIQQCRNFNIEEIAAEIIKSRSTND